MKEITINLADRYKAAFGFTAQNIIPRGLKFGAELIDKQALLGVGGNFFYFNIDTFDPINANFDVLVLRNDSLGKEIKEIKFGDMPFVKGKSLTNDIGVKIKGLFNGKEETETMPVFAPPPMISFTKSKKIKITETGGFGDVVENYSHSSWEIKLQGLLIDMVNHHYPIKQDEDLRRVFEADVVFDVQSQLLAAKGIHNIYFTKMSTSCIEGFQDTMKYTLHARSHRSIESTIEFLEQDN